MFILRIGAEALKISDNSLSREFEHSTIGKFKTPKNNLNKQRYSENNQGILYNLLQQRNIPNPNFGQYCTLCPSSKSVIDHPNSSTQDLNKPLVTKVSTPQCVRYHPYTKPKHVLLNKSNCIKKSLNINPENLIFQWLRNMVSIIKPGINGENTLWKVLHLHESDRRKILKQSWHLIFVTYLVEFIQTNDEKVKIILGLLIKDYEKTFNNGNFKKLFRLTRLFTSDLEVVIGQMIELKLSQSLFQLFRMAILFTDRHVDKDLKNMELLKPLLRCHSKEYYRRFDEVTENLFKLDMIMAESVFCEHLTQSVDKIIDDLFSQS